MTLLAVVLAGCAGADGDADQAGAPTETTPTTTAPPTGGTGEDGTASTGSTLSTTTAPSPTTMPEGSIEVPIDEELVARLPELEGGGRVVSTDVAFDERFCDGSKARTAPKSQARATYPISDTDVITIAAYRFSAGGIGDYLARYATTVRSCALEAGESQSLGVPELFGSAFTLVTEESDGFMALALYEDVMWVLYQESTIGPVEVDPTTLDGFFQTVIG